MHHLYYLSNFSSLVETLLFFGHRPHICQQQQQYWRRVTMMYEVRADCIVGSR